MSFKTTYFLFGLLMGLLVLFGLTLWYKKPPVDNSFLFPSFHNASRPIHANDVDTVEIKQGPDNYVFVRSQQGWHLQSPRVRLLGFEINLLIQEIAEARQDDEADVTNDPARWGLDRPRTVVVLRKGTGREWKLSLGNKSKEKDGVVYASSSDRPGEVLAVKRARLGGVVNFTFKKYWTRKLLTANPSVTRALAFARGTSPGAKEFALRRSSAGGAYTFVKPPYGPAEMVRGKFTLGAKPEDSPGVSGLLEDIDKLEATDLDYRHPDLKKHGLEDDSKTALRISVDNLPGPRAGETGPLKETLLIHIPDQPGGKEYFARLESEQVVYRLPAKSLETILTLWKENGERLRSLRLMQHPALAADAIDIKNVHGLIQLRRINGNVWKLKSAATGIQQAEFSEIHSLLMAFQADHQIKAFPRGDESQLGLAGSSTSVSVWVNGLATETPAGQNQDKNKKVDFPALTKQVEGQPTFKLVFGKTVKGLVYVQRQEDGVSNRVAVANGLLETVQRPALAYLNRNLSGFTIDRVTRVDLTRDKEDYQLTPDKRGSAWQLQGPAGSVRADPAQVRLLLTKLTQLRVEQWVQANPGRGDLAKYHLQDPVLVIKVTANGADGKPRTWTYDFGTEGKYTGGRAGIFSRAIISGQGGTDLVFFAAPEPVKLFQDLELRDRTIFLFNPDRVRSLKMVGLYGVKKDDDLRVRLELERQQNEAWQIKAAPQGFKLNDATVDPFLNKLAALKLYRFVKEGDKVEYKLTREKCTLSIELSLRGQQKPIWFMIGKSLNKTPYMYAWSSTLAGDIILLAGRDLEPLLTKPPWINAFKKRD